MKETAAQQAALETWLAALGPVKIAVSGGVDSLTLGLLAGRVLGQDAHLFHACSPAVPPAATARVQRLARRERWILHLVEAGEFADEAYLRNPYRRCFHCKSHLYAALASATGPGTLLAGTNTDDLAEFRPGLEAAADFQVRHPFVECGLDKAGVRRLCDRLGYPELAALPASPCLSSRIETGVRIQPPVLHFVDRVEEALRQDLEARVARCRVRPAAIAVQLDPETLVGLSLQDRAAWSRRIGDWAAPLGLPVAVCFESYRSGSAFVPDT